MNMFSYTVYHTDHTDMFCLYNLMSFVNSKGDSPIYNICIFTSYYLYIIIYHQQACLPNSKAYPKKDSQVLHGPYTGPIPSLGEYFPPPVPSIEDTTPEPKKLE